MSPQAVITIERPAERPAERETRRALLAEDDLPPLEGFPDFADATLPLPGFLEHGDSEPFRYCFNTSCVRSAGLTLPELVDIAAGAGYEAIEPWVDEIERYAGGGGDLGALRERIRDLGLTVESAIGFFEWAVDDDARRADGMASALRAMSLVARIGGKRIAAPAWGAHESGTPPLDLFKVSERYGALLRLGEMKQVVPQVEVWGFSQNLSRLGEALLVAAETGHPDACVLCDVYHLYKGGSPTNALRFVNAAEAFKVFHVNDYPYLSSETITDGDRVFPGDGIAPLSPIFRHLHRNGFRGFLSLELFNADYERAMDPLTLARTGLEKTRASVRQAFGE